MAYRKTLLPKLFWSILSCENTRPMVFKTQVLTMNLDALLQEQLMRALLGRGNPREVFRTMLQVKRNEIFWRLMNEKETSFVCKSHAR